MSNFHLSSFDALAFDVEGTLADTIPAHHSARLEAFEVHGFGHITPEQHALGPTYGSYPAQIIGGILKAAGLIPPDMPVEESKIVRDIIDTKTRIFEATAAKGFDSMPGAIDFFNVVGAMYPGRIALVTSSEAKYILPFIERYELDRVLSDEHIITHDTISILALSGKPAPDPYVLASRILFSSAMLAFEDTVPGVESAKKAGATVVGLGFEEQNAKLLRGDTLDYPPDIFVNDYSELAVLLGTTEQ